MAAYPGQGYGQPQQPQQPQRQYRPQPVEKGFFGSLFDFSFANYVTTKVVRALYVLAIIVVILFVLVGVGGGILTIADRAADRLFGGLIILGTLVAGPLLLLFYRMLLESLIVRFRMAEDLNIIRRRGDLR